MNRRGMLSLCALAALQVASPAYLWAACSDGEEADEDAALEHEIAVRMKKDGGQRRPSLARNDILARVARARAADMGQRNYFSHVNPDGDGPNILVARAGYPLPPSYTRSRDANFIESLAAGAATAEEAWSIWMNSPPHRSHILATEPFYAAQIEYGIGHAYVEGSEYGHYWVVLTAHRATKRVPGRRSSR